MASIVFAAGGDGCRRQTYRRRADEERTDDGVMILAGGFALDRPGVVTSLSEAPPWQSYEISDGRVVGVGADGAALSYRGTARGESGDPFVALMSSTYVRQGDRWRLAVYQQTPVEG